MRLRRQLTIPIVIAILMCLVVGAITGLLYREITIVNHVKTVVGDLSYLLGATRFILTRTLLEKDYSIYDFRTPFSLDEEEIVFFSDFRSPEVTRYTFESNATAPSARLIEKSLLYDSCGNQIGERGVTVFADKDQQAVRIFWTNGDVFWAIQAPTQKLAMEFERSTFVKSKAINTRCTKAALTDVSHTSNTSSYKPQSG